MSKTNVEQGGTTVHLYIHTVRGAMHDIVQLYSVNYSDGHGWNYMVHFAMTLYYQASTLNKGIIIIVWFIMTFTVLDYVTAEMSSMRGEIQCTLVMHR